MTSKALLGISVALFSMLGMACGGGVSKGSGATGGTGGNTGGTGGNTGGTGGSGATGGSTGGTGATGGSTGGTGATGGSTGGTGGALPTGDCQSDTDCAQGGKCAEITPGGFKVCLTFPPEATQCSMGGGVPDECCKTAECAAGKCYLSTSLPYCGGPAMAEYNRCVADDCASDADCKGDLPAICAPAGAFGVPQKTCKLALCATNADCAAKAGGYCAPIDAPCCSVAAGIACVYPDGCRHDTDCAKDGSKHCEIDEATKSGVCKDGPAACPA